MLISSAFSWIPSFSNSRYNNTLYAYKASYRLKILLYPLAQYCSESRSHVLAFLFSFHCLWYHLIIIIPTTANEILNIGQFYLCCELYQIMVFVFQVGIYYCVINKLNYSQMEIKFHKLFLGKFEDLVGKTARV